jgi:hypothetical protein
MTARTLLVGTLAALMLATTPALATETTADEWNVAQGIARTYAGLLAYDKHCAPLTGGALHFAAKLFQSVDADLLLVEVKETNAAMGEVGTAMWRAGKRPIVAGYSAK